MVGKPGLTDHNVMDDMIKNPPKNLPGDPSGDRTTGTGAEEETNQPNTVEAKPVEESMSSEDRYLLLYADAH